MQIMKIILPVVLVGTVSFSWFQFASSVASEQITYNRYLHNAETSCEKGLYEQAVEYYKSSLSYKQNPDIYSKINEACEKFYAEETTPYVRNFYINNILEIIDAVPEEPSYWIKAINLYKEKNDYSSAYNIVKRAKRSGIENEEIDSVYFELRYMTKIEWHKYLDYKTALNGYISVYDDKGWQVVSNTGGNITSEYYDFIGLVGDNGVGMYTNSIDTRIIDKSHVTRARFPFTVQEAGIYSMEMSCIPVLTDGVWKYVNLNGEFMKKEYQEAGCFCNGKSAVKENNRWYLIDINGNKSSDEYDEIKLDLHGSYLQGNVIIVKSGGRYSICNSSFEKVSDFSCDDIDVCLKNELIAYKDNGKWGFVDTDGNVVIEPSYQNAKSFSNGLAAVCSEDKWGFIDKTNRLVIDYQFADADYFNSDNYCMISQDGETYQLMHLMFD